MKLNHSKKILVLAAIVFVIIVALDIISSHLMIEKIYNINYKIKQQNISTQERARDLNLKESVINSEAERVRLEKYFISSGDAATADFIIALEARAKEFGLTANIKSVGYETVTSQETITAVSVLRLRLSVTGKWSSVFSFLQSIENLPKITSINNVSLSASSKTWSADLDFSVVKLNN